MRKAVMKETEVINISGNFVIYSSLLPYPVSHPLIISQPDCFTYSLTFQSVHNTVCFQTMYWVYFFELKDFLFYGVSEITSTIFHINSSLQIHIDFIKIWIYSFPESFNIFKQQGSTTLFYIYEEIHMHDSVL